MRIAIMGAGSLGTILGAYIARSGRDVTLVDSYKEHVDALNEHGAKIVGEVEFTQPVKACLPSEMEGIYDIVIYMTKAPANKTALPQLLPHLNENSVVITMQNGLPEEAVASYVGKERTMGGTVGWGASFQGPGVSKLTSTLDIIETHAFEIGELDDVVRDRTKKVQEVLSSMGNTDILPSLASARWSKLFLNAVYSGLSAALGDTYGGVEDNELAFEVSLHVGNEVATAARLNGVELLENFQDVNLKKMEFNSEEEKEHAAPLMRKLVRPHRGIFASMLNDMKRGIWETEIQEIDGSVSRAGKKVNYPTPFIDKVIELVERAQATKTLPTMENVNEFKPLLENFKF